MHRARPSRRSACDRCRAFKLKCERATSQGNYCQRCVKTGIRCVTTPAMRIASPGSPRGLPGSLCHQRSRINSSASSIAVISPESNYRPGEANVRVPDANSNFPEIGDNSKNDHYPIDMSLSDFAFSATCDNSYERSPASSSIGNWVYSGNPMSIITEGWDDKGPQSPVKSLFELCANIVSESTRIGRNELDSSFPDSTMNTEASIQSLLNRTSELLGILKQMMTDEEEKAVAPAIDTGEGRTQPTELNSMDCVPSPVFMIPLASPSGQYVRAQLENESERDRSSEVQPKVQDVTTTSTLVSAYILITRAWRNAFKHIHTVQLECAREGKPLTLALPSLNLGGFNIQMSPDVQIPVLLEFCTTMIRSVEASMGIANSAVCSNASEGAKAKRLALSMDPISISLRETMLSHEMLSPTQGVSSNRLSLKEIMDDIRKQLVRHS